MTIAHSSRFDRSALINGTAGRSSIGLAALGVLHGTALIAIYLTEYGPFAQTVALLAWAFLNFLWLMLVRRPAVAAALSLLTIAGIIALSQFKFNVLEMTLSFFDVLIIDPDTIAYLLTIFPDLRVAATVAALLAILLLIVLWRADCRRVRMRTAICGAVLSLTAMAGLSSLVPEEPWEPFSGVNHVSNFSRSGVLSVSELIHHGWLESDAAHPRSPHIAGERAMSARAQAAAHHPPAR